MFEKIKKNFGFGCMRLPMKEKQVDYEQFCKMIDYFIENGFNYFDTAHGYLQGQSEIAIKDCLVKRYAREKYILTNKLTESFFESENDIISFFNMQLEICGVDYFDFYLMHAQNHNNFQKFKKCKAYEQAFELKKQGKIKHVGISFHDSAEVLDEILNTYPQIEIVQIQFNYLDYEDPLVQSKKCYDICVKHHKPVIVMEPIKGGNLVNLPIKANQILKDLNNRSNASYAIRFAASFENVVMVLSGMSTMDQMKDNVSFMKEFKPLDKKEKEAIDEVCKVFNSMEFISCTKCCYCIADCVKKIPIPDIFSCMNAKNIYPNWNAKFYYKTCTLNKGKASDCISCGKCEKICPQHLPIRKLLKEVAFELENI